MPLFIKFAGKALPPEIAASRLEPGDLVAYKRMAFHDYCLAYKAADGIFIIPSGVNIDYVDGQFPFRLLARGLPVSEFGRLRDIFSSTPLWIDVSCGVLNGLLLTYFIAPDPHNVLGDAAIAQYTSELPIRFDDQKVVPFKRVVTTNAAPPVFKLTSRIKVESL